MQNFHLELETLIAPERVISDYFLCCAYAADASPYALTPKLVILVQNQTEVVGTIKLAGKYGAKLTFRAAGTSLSGQAVTDQVLVVLQPGYWNNHRIINNAEQIFLESGVVGHDANLYLKPYNKKIGPDPASIKSCKIGGIVANNSSGMCCGTVHNTYNTLKYITFTLANGATVNTADPASCAQFKLNYPDIIAGIKQLHEQVNTNSTITEFLRSKFSIKNTSGYSLNAFIDFSDPLEILAHLMVGSEGTLGFIGNVTYNTVDDDCYKAVSLIYFDDIASLSLAAVSLAIVPVAAIELLDIVSLTAISECEHIQQYLPILGVDTSALLIEVSAMEQNMLAQKILQVEQVLAKFTLLKAIKFTTDADTYNDLWDIRKGVFTVVGAKRVAGSMLILEDVAVAMPRLPELVYELRKLFNQYNYTNVAIFGHVLAGNLHFLLTPQFKDKQQIEAYNSFMHDLTQLVTQKLAGSLKAEHGAGRHVAPFLQVEWGTEVYAIFWQVKQLLDPTLIFNPDVMLTHNLQLHVQNLKQMGNTDPIVDKCIECGYCEQVCPSAKLNLTPRQRITAYRKLEKLLHSKQTKLYDQFKRSYKKYAIDSCATTGLCANHCPVNINTGELMLKLKQKPKQLIGRILGNNFSTFVRLNRLVLKLVNSLAFLVGKTRLHNLSCNSRKIIPIIPLYLPTTPLAQTAQFNFKQPNPSKLTVVYLPSCNNRIFADSSSTNSHNAVEKLLAKLGYAVIFPAELNNLCCGQLFSSSGYTEMAEHKLAQIEEIFSRLDYTVVIDNSSCFNYLHQHSAVKNQLVDITSFIFNHLDKLSLTPKYQNLAVHIDCSSIKLGQEKKLLDILNYCAKETTIPRGVNCCGFAGTKGFTQPELNQSALADLARQISACDIGVTCNRNCQIGLSYHGQKPYLSLAEVVLNCIK